MCKDIPAVQSHETSQINAISTQKNCNDSDNPSNESIENVPEKVMENNQ